MQTNKPKYRTYLILNYFSNITVPPPNTATWDLKMEGGLLGV